MSIVIVITLALLVGLAVGGYSTRIRTAENKDRAFGSRRDYLVSVNPFNPKDSRRLYTPHGDDEAIARAVKNPEDFS